jgi:hypothetical protein
MVPEEAEVEQNLPEEAEVEVEEEYNRLNCCPDKNVIDCS